VGVERTLAEAKLPLIVAEVVGGQSKLWVLEVEL
jgi:hypothetical protein